MYIYVYKEGLKMCRKNNFAYLLILHTALKAIKYFCYIFARCRLFLYVTYVYHLKFCLSSFLLKWMLCILMSCPMKRGNF